MRRRFCVLGLAVVATIAAYGAGASPAQADWCTGSRIANLGIHDRDTSPDTLLGHLEIYYNSAGTNCAMTTSRGVPLTHGKRKRMSVELDSCNINDRAGGPCHIEHHVAEDNYFYEYAGPVGVDGWNRCIWARGLIRYGGYEGSVATASDHRGSFCD